MVAKIDESRLDEKLAELESIRRWSPRVISKLENLIRSDEDFDVFRINPLDFAARNSIAETEALDLFLHGVAGSRE